MKTPLCSAVQALGSTFTGARARRLEEEFGTVEGQVEVKRPFFLLVFVFFLVGFWSFYFFLHFSVGFWLFFVGWVFDFLIILSFIFLFFFFF